ncbi:uncharacterized protein TNCV_3754801 [Trichonephila clavipes]|nr:uncharacterized protein TNCV_3754801 [Trichonephila clavipes]
MPATCHSTFQGGGNYPFPLAGVNGPSHSYTWPPRSPDLSPCDYWLWGYLKSQVYRDRPTSLGMLKDNIRLQCLTITPDMFYSTVHNITPRLQLLLRNDGEHIEHFL